MTANHLSVNLSLEQLRKRAKELRDFVRAGNPKFTQPFSSRNSAVT